MNAEAEAEAVTQIPRSNFRVLPVALSKNRVWTLSKLGPNHIAYWQCSHTNQISQGFKVDYIYTSSQQPADFGGSKTKLIMQLTPIIIDCHLSTGPGFPSESVQMLFSIAHTKNFAWGQGY